MPVEDSAVFRFIILVRYNYAVAFCNYQSNFAQLLFYHHYNTTTNCIAEAFLVSFREYTGRWKDFFRPEIFEDHLLRFGRFTPRSANVVV